jgi:hypothetical protein
MGITVFNGCLVRSGGWFAAAGVRLGSAAGRRIICRGPSKEGEQMTPRAEFFRFSEGNFWEHKEGLMSCQFLLLKRKTTQWLGSSGRSIVPQAQQHLQGIPPSS